MNRNLFFVIAFAALVASQSLQNGASISSVTNGVPVNVVFPVTTEDTAYDQQVYALYVPENTASINITLTETDAVCSELQILISPFNIPCSPDQYDYLTTPCTNYVYEETVDTSYSYSYLVSNDDNTFVVNTWYYISVGRYYASDYSNICTGTLTAMYTTTGSNGTVAAYIDVTETDGIYSVAYTPVSTASSIALTNTPANTLSEYKMTVPEFTAWVQMTITSADNNGVGLGRARAAAGTDSSYTDCYGYDGNVQANGNYVTLVTCVLPHAGDFYFGYYTTAVQSATLTFQILTCPTGLSGPNCTTPVMQVNPLALNSTYSFTVAGYGTGDDYDNLYLNQVEVYFNITSNFTGIAGPITLFVTSPNTDAGYLYVSYRRDGIPSDQEVEVSSSVQEVPIALVLTRFDFEQSGLFILAFICDQSANCQFNVAVNASAASTTGMATMTSGKQATTAAPVPINTSGATTFKTSTGRITSGSAMSGSLTTGANVSPASIVVPSIFVAIATIFALVF